MKLNELKNLTEDLTADICKMYDIKNYTVGKDGLLEVHGNVVFRREYFSSLPVKFSKVHGNFLIMNCEELETLKGAPTWIGGDFSCSNSKKLQTLKYGPEIVEGIYDCDNCNELTSLKYGPTTVNSHFNCSNCEKLESLEGAPISIKGAVHVMNCPKLTKLSHFKYIKWDMDLSNTPIDNLLYVFKIKELTVIKTGNDKVDKIINKHLSSDRDIMACQEELIEAGLGRYARLK